jgi:hypothetical protein
MVIRALWQAMERFGLGTGANILEPSMGVGHFFGLMPDSLLPGCRRTGVRQTEPDEGCEVAPE